MLRLLIIPVVLLALLAGAMMWAGDRGEAPANFVCVNQDEIGTLDPRGMSWTQDLRLSYALWEGLYAPDPRTMKPTLGTADRVEVSEDQRTYTFHIRENARWSNGDAVVAGDFIFAWRRLLEEPGNYSYLFNYIDGAQEYKDAFAENRPCDLSSVGIQQIDMHKLRVTLKHPAAFFPDICAMPAFFPVHEPSMRPFRIVDPKTGHATYDARFTRPPNLVTNGPYRLQSWEFRKKIRLVASDYYWNRAAVKSRIIDVLNFSDVRTSFLKYEMGGVDWLASINSVDASDLLARGRKDVHLFPGFGTEFYALNCRPKFEDGRDNPLADVRVRRALCMGLDRRPIVENVARLNQPIATSFIPPGAFPAYRPPTGLAFDPQKARELLAEAGYPGGRGLPVISMLYNEGGENSLVAQIIGRQWRENLGIRVELIAMESKIFRNRVRTHNFEIARASWIGDYYDLSTFTDKFLSTSDNNQCSWANGQYDSLCRAAAQETDAAKRMQLYHDAEQILCDESPIVPLYHYTSVYLFRDDVSGIPLDPRTMTVFQSIMAKDRR